MVRACLKATQLTARVLLTLMSSIFYSLAFFYKHNLSELQTTKEEPISVTMLMISIELIIFLIKSIKQLNMTSGDSREAFKWMPFTNNSK